MLGRITNYVSSLFKPSPSPAASASSGHSPRKRHALAELTNSRPIRGRYDGAGSSDEYAKYWANADHLDADAGHDSITRQRLVSRSRYEVQSNGYADGIAQTWSTDLAGLGPKLRMLSGSTAFNQLVEAEFERWAKAVLFRRKLWCMAHAKHQDGEGFGVLRTNRKVKHPVMLDVVLYETEQCATPMLPFTEAGRIDGIQFDEFGNVEFYDILRQHPGSSLWFNHLTTEPERIPARFVLHWFKLRRPGQHRGVPDTSSTLNVGATAKRWREATVAAAETAADFSVLLKSMYEPDEEDADDLEAMSTMEIQKRMMVTLPNSVEAQQLEAKHPNTQFAMLHEKLINEQARPKNMPYNKAACDSSKYNYASGRLDHQTYYAALDVDREDVNDLALDPLFDVWFDEAIRVFRWLGGNPKAVGAAARAHLWDWPKHRVADVTTEASANQTKLKTGMLTLSAYYSECGSDFEDEIIKMAADFGVTVDEMRKVLLNELYPAGAKVLLPPPAPPTTPANDAASDEESADDSDDSNDTANEEEEADAAVA